MIRFTIFFKLNKINIVDSPFNENPKTYNFFQGDINFKGGMAGKFMDNGQ